MHKIKDLPIASLDAPLAKALSKVVGSSTRAGAKILHQPAYILHSQPYSETSLLLDVFTRNHGRLLVMAKGALRPYTRWRASIFQTFQTLSMGFSGKGAVRTLLCVSTSAYSSSFHEKMKLKIADTAMPGRPSGR